jgi:16S rRNA (cytosine967-C5)-methyltransferase
MRPAARLQAAIEILDQVIESARDDGPPADVLVTRYFKTRRYAGSKDRRLKPRRRSHTCISIRSS